MTALLKKHRGKAAAGISGAVVLALVQLLSRGCDLRVHVDPVHARTNSLTRTN